MGDFAAAAVLSGPPITLCVPAGAALDRFGADFWRGHVLIGCYLNDSTNANQYGG